MAPREPHLPVGRGPAVRRSAVHLLIGDSIGRDSGLESRLRRDVMLNRCRGGATADSILRSVEYDLRHWDISATVEQLPLGTAVYWISANDVYNRFTGSGSIEADKLQLISLYIRRVIQQLLSRTDSVVVLGPLPRLDGDASGLAWEKTAAFHLERTAKKVVEEILDRQEGGACIKFVPLGRYLTKKERGRHSVRAECAEWFRDDWVHLSQSGYRKLSEAEHLPVWLKFNH